MIRSRGLFSFLISQWTSLEKEGSALNRVRSRDSGESLAVSQRWVPLIILAVLSFPAWAIAQATDPERISQINDTTPYNGNSSMFPSRANHFSADNKLMVFASSATNITGGASSGMGNIYLYNFTNDTTTLISKNAEGEEANGWSLSPSISYHGDLVVYASKASNLGPSDNDDYYDIYAYDVFSGTTQLLSSPSIFRDAKNPAISGNGEYVVFQADVHKGLDESGDQFNQSVVYRIAMADQSISRVSHREDDPDSSSEHGDSTFPSISYDGTVVAFQSEAIDMSDPRPEGGEVCGAVACFDHIYYWKSDTQEIFPVSRNAGENDFGNGDSVYATVSGDGTAVAFQSLANNIASGRDAAADALWDIYSFEVDTGVVNFASRDVNTEGNGDSIQPSLSYSGRSIFFTSKSTNLDPSDIDQDSFFDVYRFHRGISKTELFSKRGDAVQPMYDGYNIEPVISPALNKLAFTSSSSQIAGDWEGGYQVLVMDPGLTPSPLPNFAPKLTSLSTSPDQVKTGLPGFNLVVNFLDPNNDTHTADIDWDDGTTLHNHPVTKGTPNPIGHVYEAAGTYDITVTVTDSGDGNLTDTMTLNINVVDAAPAAQSQVPTPSVQLSENRDSLLSFQPTEMSEPETITRLSEDPVGLPGDGASTTGRNGLRHISQDGRYVVFQSQATTLHPLDSDPEWDIYRYDTIGGSIDLISVSASGEKGNRASTQPTISADGTLVTFQSRATNLHADDSSGDWDIFIRDLSAGTTSLLSRADGETGAKGNSHSQQPSISADGTYVTFQSVASNLFTGLATTGTQVYVRDRANATTSLVSVNAVTELGNGPSIKPVISADGRWIAYQSKATNLHAAAATDTHWDIFLTEWQGANPAPVLVSRDTAGTGSGNWPSLNPTISADGQFVAFQSKATNVHGDDSQSQPDIYVYDRDTDTVALVSNGLPPGRNQRPSISGDGCLVAYQSSATTLHPDDSTAEKDVYVYNRADQSTMLISRVGVDGAKGDQASHSPTLSNDATLVAFTSQADNLAEGHSSSVPQVFLKPFSLTACQ